jgi:RNA polymerase sigma-70 factor (ECF subfamily)
LPGVGELPYAGRVPDGTDWSDGLAEAVTDLLLAWGEGDRQALDRLVPLVYAELRRRARVQLSRERGSHTLQPTALVHETFLRLVDQRDARWRNRAQFFAVSARLMRRILVDHARARAAAKRGGDAVRVALDVADETATGPETDILVLHETLERLASQDERQAHVVELRYFGGLSVEEVASVLEVSEITVKRDWAMARAWLFRELGGAAGKPAPGPG